MPRRDSGLSKTLTLNILTDIKWTIFQIQLIMWENPSVAVVMQMIPNVMSLLPILSVLFLAFVLQLPNSNITATMLHVGTNKHQIHNSKIQQLCQCIYPFSLTFSKITYPTQNGVSRKKDHRLSTRDRLQTHAMGDSSSPTLPTSLVSPAPKVKITTRLQYEIPKRHVNHVLRISPDRWNAGHEKGGETIIGLQGMICISGISKSLKKVYILFMVTLIEPL